MGVEGRINILVDDKVKPAEISSQVLYPSMQYVPSGTGGAVGGVDGFDAKRERMHLTLLRELVDKRKYIRDQMQRRLDELIVYCDNQILAVGDGVALKADTQFEGKSPARFWRASIVDLEKQKAIEEKDFFRDTLFLKNEWVKVTLDFEEQKGLEEMLRKM